MEGYSDLRLNGCTVKYDEQFGIRELRRIWSLPSSRIGFGYDEITSRIREDHDAIAFRIPEVFAHLPLWEFFSTRPIDKYGSRVIGVIYPREQTGEDVLETLGKALDKYALNKLFPFE